LFLFLVFILGKWKNLIIFIAVGLSQGDAFGKPTDLVEHIIKALATLELNILKRFGTVSTVPYTITLIHH
jgi:hypothetical protein